MAFNFFSRPRRLSRLAATAVSLVCLAGCHPNGNGSGGNGGTPATTDYQAIVSAFTIGLAGLESGVEAGPDVKSVAEQKLTDVTKMAPDEPAGWADLGLVQMEKNEFPQATANLKKAHELAPNSAEIVYYQAVVADRQGDPAGSAALLKTAVGMAPTDIRIKYQLALEDEKLGAQADLNDPVRLMQEVVSAAPINLEAVLELARFAAKAGDAATLKDAVARLTSLSSTWSTEAKSTFKDLQTAAAAPDVHPAAIQVQYLRNTLKKDLGYQAAVKAISVEVSGPVPLQTFLKLPRPSSKPAPADVPTVSNSEPMPGLTGCAYACAFVPDDRADAKPLTVQGGQIKWGTASVPFPGAAPKGGLAPGAICVVDLNHDYLNDVVAAGPSGLKIYQQGTGGTLADVTAKADLPGSIAAGALAGVWPVDIESDGDIDLIVAPVSGPPVVLQNRANGTYKPLSLFPGVSSVRDVAVGDSRDDGVSDIALLDASGKVHVFVNKRSGAYVERKAPAFGGPVCALATADVTGDGTISLIALNTDGTLSRATDVEDGKDWNVVVLAHPSGQSKFQPGTVKLFTADLDNNGAADIIASAPDATTIWFADDHYAVGAGLAVPGIHLYGLAETNASGHLSPIGIDASGNAVTAGLKYARSYGWQDYRLRASERGTRPDSSNPQNTRVNTFGIGGTFEIRAGLLAEKQIIGGPIVHFGLGDHPQTDVVRIVWPNGMAQTEFQEPGNQGLKSGITIAANQRLTSSCPYLFAFNGKEMAFITDCIWRSPLGLKINAQDTAGVSETEDWLKIRGDQLAPRDGSYDLRITAELWETHFFDTLQLRVVDHPIGSEIWVDERFSVPPPPKQIYASGPLHPVSHAWDDNGHDVTRLVHDRDGIYVDNFGRGQFQGVTRDHWLELDLSDAPADSPLLLVANGWIHPTDSNINVAIGQANVNPPKGLSLEVPDAQGHWQVAKPGLGFPEGKVKTILIDLTDVFKPGAPRRVRLRTNLEIFWDSVGWAEKTPNVPLQITRLTPESAELNRRGFSVITARDASSPELPVGYSVQRDAVQPWRDLIGYYTRYGDVTPLLTKVDDRYVIMNAGDELRLKFAALPEPRAGWQRDYVLIGDGWVKDGNFNTGFSRTVLPLPAHNIHTYNTPPTDLASDPVYRRHSEDWREYHTRYVTPDTFSTGLFLRGTR
jgi:hypothetical protein